MKNTEIIETKVPHYVEDILEEIAVLKSKVIRGKNPHKTRLLNLLEHFVPLLKVDFDGNVSTLIDALLSSEEEVAIDTVTRINRIIGEVK